MPFNFPLYTKTMIEITPTIYFDETEVIYNFVRAAGPGGQNVNGVCRKTLPFLQTNRSLYLFRLLRALPLRATIPTPAVCFLE